MMPWQTPQQLQQARAQQLQLPIGNRPIQQVARILYMQDGFLHRLALSPYHPQFVLSGGMFLFKLTLAQAAQLRPTQDTDFLCQLPLDTTRVSQAIQTIVATPLPDFLDFVATSVRVTPIMGVQGGLNVRVEARLGTALETVTLDLAFGQTPQAQVRALPTFLGIPATIPVWSEAIEAVMAGKVAAMIRHGAKNTRCKDYYDVWSLAQSQNFAGSVLTIALATACQKDGITPDPTAPIFASPQFPHDPQQLQQWQDYLTREGLTQRAPTFLQAIATIRALYGPVVNRAASGHTWQASAQQWQ